ncbi:recombinase family protein [Bacillus sp. B1-b2]|uniref:recombinase family protein n=1 Tax=Bacillus sp. B1-b2 TaxID=2653201 RepID=UPI001261DC6F|nr:recombinase family protein [Bacillus sp. B1-b2]KAB7672546.1 recombinase family protein [Bacillus sp. B1-b2]
MKCAIYIRTASKNNTDYHLKTQSDRLKQFISDHNWQLYNSYIDIGSGPKNHENLQAMVEDAQNNKFDVILSTDASRLLRIPELSSKMKKLCKMKKIHIMTLDRSINTLQGNVDVISLYAWIIEQESTKQSQRIKFGKKKRLLDKQS